MQLLKKCFGLYQYSACVRFLDLNTTAYLNPTLRYWYADPFCATINDKVYLFTEQFDKLLGYGKIAVSEVDNGAISKPKTIISGKFHASFPVVFKYNNNYYMIPETYSLGKIVIYKMESDVYSWEMVSSFDIENCTDTAVLINDDEIYLLSSEINKCSRNQSRLKLFLISDINKNEIIDCTESSGLDKSYSFNIRNAGNFYFDGNDLYRTSQVSDENYYGRSVCIFKVEDIDKSSYVEKLVKTIVASDYTSPWKKYSDLGTHTYNKYLNIETYDIRGVSYSLWNFISKSINTTISLFHFTDNIKKS